MSRELDMDWIARTIVRVDLFERLRETGFDAHIHSSEDPNIIASALEARGMVDQPSRLNNELVL